MMPLFGSRAFSSPPEQTPDPFGESLHSAPSPKLCKWFYTSMDLPVLGISFHINGIVHYVAFRCRGFSHLASCLQVLPTIKHVSVFHPLPWLDHVLSCTYTAFSSYIVRSVTVSSGKRNQVLASSS